MPSESEGISQDGGTYRLRSQYIWFFLGSRLSLCPGMLRGWGLTLVAHGDENTETKDATLLELQYNRDVRFPVSLKLMEVKSNDWILAPRAHAARLMLVLRIIG